MLYRYTADGDKNLFRAVSILNYAHNGNPAFIPYEKTENKILNGAYFFGNNQRQHYMNYTSTALKQMAE